MASYTTEQLLDYDHYAWKEGEIQTRIEDARLAGEKGRPEEHVKAKAEKQVERIEIAKKMLSKGFDISDIADLTGFSIEDVMSL